MRRRVTPTVAHGAARTAGRPATRQEIEDLVRAVRQAHVVLDAGSVAAQVELGIARTDLATLELVSVGDRLSAGDIADRLRISTGTATGVVDRLVAGGYVARRTDPRDRRRILVSITPKGRRRFREAFQRRWEWLNQVASELSSAELARIVSFLSRMPEMAADGVRPAPPSIGADAEICLGTRGKQPGHPPPT